MPTSPRQDLLSLTQLALARVLRRETVRLLALIAVAVATTFLTRAIADSVRERERREAAEWFDRGSKDLEHGDADAAAASFRRAAIKRRGDNRYVLALADALARTGNLDAAERALVAIRQSNPEDPQINLALARAAAARGDLTTAVRYYHNALYAPWAAADGPRGVRLELIRLLLDRGDARGAVAELIAATTDLPGTAAAHNEIGTLFARAADHGRALDQFTRALALDAQNRASLAGAGRAAFALGDYARARRYLHSVRGDDETATLAAVADLVLTRDPLASRISAAERRRRLVANLTHAHDRLEKCLMAQMPDLAPLLAREMAGLRADRRSIARDADVLEAAVNLTYRIEQHAQARCGDATPLDRALLLVAQRHGLDQP